jgi:hypothetical protein
MKFVAVAAAVFTLLTSLPASFSFSTLSTIATRRRTTVGDNHSHQTPSERCHFTSVHKLAMAEGGSSKDDEKDGGGDGDDEKKVSYNPFDNETAEELESRMKLVRQLQKTFYGDEEGAQLPDEHNSDDESADASVIRNLPLWRVQWTELPGSQNVLNVHEGHYTNMFQKLLRGRSKSWGDEEDEDSGDSNDADRYFGHVFLSGGSKNLDNPDYALKEGDVGTLMKVCDARQQPDGRLTVIVQALERFEIHKVERTLPYSIADVSLLPDKEQMMDLAEEAEQWDEARAMAASMALADHPFEYRRVTVDSCEIVSDDGKVVGLGVSPLSNYDAKQVPTNTNTGIGGVDEDDVASAEHRNKVALAESQTWMQLDQMIKLLNIASNGVGVPVPTQLMGLLPKSRSVPTVDDATSAIRVTEQPWPETFELSRIVKQMEETPKATVGTHSKSPFVRVDDDYSPLRRAQRLSYVVWTLTESISLPYEKGSNPDAYARESVLAIISTKDRLELATEKMIRICNLLKRVLSSRGDGKVI